MTQQSQNEVDISDIRADAKQTFNRVIREERNAKELAWIPGYDRQSIYKFGDLNAANHVSAELLIALYKISQNPEILRFLERHLNVRITPEKDLKTVSSPLLVFKEFLDGQNAMLKQFTDSLEDGEIDRREAAQLTRQAKEIIRTQEKLIASLSRKEE